MVDNPGLIYMRGAIFYEVNFLIYFVCSDNQLVKLNLSKKIVENVGAIYNGGYLQILRFLQRIKMLFLVFAVIMANPISGQLNTTNTTNNTLGFCSAKGAPSCQCDYGYTGLFCETRKNFNIFRANIRYSRFKAKD